VGLLQAPPLLTALLVVPLIGTALTVLLIIGVAGLWVQRQEPLSSRVYHTVIAFALAGFILFLYYWGLPGFHY
jgi:hypothetical protein